MGSNEVDIKAVLTADDQASKVMSNFGSNSNKTMTAVGAAVAAAGAALTLYTKNATDYTTQLGMTTKHLGEQTGTTAEQASALLYVTQRLGVSAEETEAVFGIFSKQISATANAADVSKTMLGELGVSVKNANGTTKDFNTVLFETADAFAKMPDGAIKTADAMKLFGRSGKDMLPVLNLGAQGIKDLETQAQKLGLTLSTDNVASIYKYIQAQKNLTDSQNALKIQIGQLTAPVLATLDNALAKTTQKLIDVSGPLHGVVAGAIAAGGPIMSAAGGFIALAANIEQALPLLIGMGTALVAILPEILAVGAVVAAAGFLWKTLSDRAHSAGKSFDDTQDALRRTNDGLMTQAVTLDDVNAKWHDYNRSQEDVVGAQLDVEQAQNSYTDAVKSYGASSIEARQAAHNLAEANYSLEDAQNKANTAQQDYITQEQTYQAQTNATVAAVNIRIDAIDGIALHTDIAAGKVANLDLSIRNANSQVGNLVQTSQKVGTIKFTPTTGVPLGHLAGGTDNWRGGMTMVGENGPEILNLPQGSQVIPHDKIGGGGGSTTVNIAVNAQAFMGSQIQARQFAQQIFQALQDYAASKNTSVAEMVAA